MENNNFSANLIEYLGQLKKLGVPEKEYQEHVLKYLEFTAREKAIPLHGTFELTPLCNLDCKMCYIHLDNTQFSKNKLLSVSVWKELIDEAFISGMRNATITGGECLTYPSFEEVFIYLSGKGVSTGIMTNGILLNKEKIKLFKEYSIRSIQVTIYGSNNDIYERVTGKRSFDIVMENILLAKDANLPIRIAITPNRFLEDDLDTLIEVVDSLGIPYFINAFLNTPRENTGRKKEDMTVEQYINAYKKRIHLKLLQESVSTNLSELPEPNHKLQERIGLTCGAGRSSFVIKYDGRMSPCVSLSHITSEPLQYGFKEAWNQINAKANAYILPSECGECYYRDVCLKCAAIHKDAPVRGHCDPIVCQRTMKMIRAGVFPLPGNENSG